MSEILTITFPESLPVSARREGTPLGEVAGYKGRFNDRLTPGSTGLGTNLPRTCAV